MDWKCKAFEELTGYVEKDLIGLSDEELRARTVKFKADLEAGVSLDDLRFQVEQLKGRLTGLNANSSVNQTETQERVQTAEVKLRDEMERLVGHAEQVALYLRSQGSKPIA